jgi:hypothetical protein
LTDPAQRLLLDTLARAAARPAGLPLPRQAARRGRDNLLRIVRRERHGKTIRDVCALTANGLAYLLEHHPHYQAIAEHLSAWHEGGALGDCPLPELFRRLHADDAGLTIGLFHDRLRLMHQGARIYLHPWTGPLYVMPEPAHALLVGHEIAYYASLRDSPLAALHGAASGHEDLP